MVMVDGGLREEVNGRKKGETETEVQGKGFKRLEQK
jgi:hypothetical protein